MPVTTCPSCQVIVQVEPGREACPKCGTVLSLPSEPKIVLPVAASAPAPSYPALAVISTIYRVTGVLTFPLGVLASFGFAVSSSGPGYSKILVVAGGTIVSILAGIAQLATAELLVLFMQIEKNTRK